jgi:hypothetical protein
MTMHLNREASGDQELVLHYTDMDGRAVRIFLPVLFGVFAALPLWLLFLAVNQLLVFMGLGLTGPPFEDPSATWPPVVAVGLVLFLGIWMFGWLTVVVGMASWRSTRGSWWLRLSSRGFEVNDRLPGRPRRYEWREIDKFMLIAPLADVHAAVVAPAKTFAEAVNDGDTGLPVLLVGFHCSPGHRRRTLANRLWRMMRGHMCGRDGTEADVVGYWDRPFDEAVDLMNEWLARYKTA